MRGAFESLRNILKEKYNFNGYLDIIGDIAIVNVPIELEGKKKVIAEAVMAVNRNIRTVLNQASPVSGEYRLRSLEWLSGERKTETVYKEYGCSFRVDLSKVYFSPRLSYERMRIARLVREGEIVVNMFAGVGCFSIVIGKNSKVDKVHSIDINPNAVELMKENIALNKFKGRLEANVGDAKEVIEERFPGISHRVLMPLPEKAYQYLDTACLALKPEGGFIHYYDFVYARRTENAIGSVAGKVRKRLTSLGRPFEVVFSRVVRTIGPNWYQVVLDLSIASSSFYSNYPL